MVIPYDTPELPDVRMVPPLKGRSSTEPGPGPISNTLNNSGLPQPMVPLAAPSAQGPVIEERGSEDLEMQMPVMAGATSPELMELLQAIVARLPPEGGPEAPPSYYTE